MGEVLFTHADIPGAYWVKLAEPNGKQITSHSSIIRGAYWVILANPECITPVRIVKKNHKILYNILTIYFAEKTTYIRHKFNTFHNSKRPSDAPTGILHISQLRLAHAMPAIPLSVRQMLQLVGVSSTLGQFTHLGRHLELVADAVEVQLALQIGCQRLRQ